MATAVEVPNVLLMSDPSPSCDQPSLQSRVKIQNAYLACTIIRDMLKSENMNGLHRLHDSRRFTHEVINEPGFKEAVATLDKCCRYLKEKKESEMEVLVSTLDITDTQLCTNYQKIADHLMADDIKFGRVGSLFFFTFVLCKRLHIEGRQREIESVVDWLARFLDDKIAPWLIQNHGGKWVSHVFESGGMGYGLVVILSGFDNSVMLDCK